MSPLLIPLTLLGAFAAGYFLQRRFPVTMKVALGFMIASIAFAFLPIAASASYGLLAFYGAMIFGLGATQAERKNERDKLKVARPEFKHCPHCTTRLVERDFEGKKKLACPFCTFVYWNNPIPVAVAVIPSGDGLVLVKRKVPPKIGMWALPAGFLETGEGPEAAAVREAKEEAGVDIEIERHLVNFPLPHVNQVLIVFLAKPITQAPQPGSDAEEAKVFAKDALPEEIAFPLHKQAIDLWRAAA